MTNKCMYQYLQLQDKKKRTALHVAVRYNNHKAISLLHHIYPDTIDDYGVNAVQSGKFHYYIYCHPWTVEVGLNISLKQEYLL